MNWVFGGFVVVEKVYFKNRIFWICVSWGRSFFFCVVGFCVWFLFVIIFIFGWNGFIVDEFLCEVKLERLGNVVVDRIKVLKYVRLKKWNW